MERVADFLLKCKHSSKLTVLTGAGISTYSGIPDYRGKQGVYTRQPNYKPIEYRQFIGNDYMRRRYWARSFIGWPTIQKAQPNVVHETIHQLDQMGFLNGVITQNVDGLHLGYGALQEYIELHGSLHRVECLQCHTTLPRSDMQEMLLYLNPGFELEYQKQSPSYQPDVASSRQNPDGDVDMLQELYENFKYPSCPSCLTGMLKPSVVFFGENMKPDVRDRAMHVVRSSSGLLVMGSSLTVYSAFRLVKAASETAPHGIVILNQGPTRADSSSLSNVFKAELEAHVLKDILHSLS